MGANEAVLLLNGFNQYPNGWMAVSNKVREAIVPALTLVVGAWLTSESSLMDVPHSWWVKWRNPLDPNANLTMTWLNTARASCNVGSVEVR